MASARYIYADSLLRRKGPSVTGQNVEDRVRRRPKDRKQQILAHARDLFVEQGYHNVTMGAIASRVGIGPSALYRHFANKAVLLEAVIEDSFGDIEFPASGDIPLDEVIAEAASIAVARPLGVLWSREARHLPPEVRESLRERLRRSAEGYERLLRRDRPQLTAGQAELLARAIQSVMASPSYRSVRIPASTHVEVLIRAARAVAGARMADIGAAGPSVARKGLSPVSRRERLLLAASRLFAEQGYQETSLDDIGSAAEVTGPNLYGYFENKAAVLRAVLDRGTHSLWLDLDQALSRTSDPREALALLAHAYVSRFAAQPRMVHQLTGEVEIEERSVAYQREYVAEWVALVRAVRPELDQRDARHLVHIALSVADDLTTARHLASTEGFVADASAVVVAVLEA